MSENRRKKRLNIRNGVQNKKTSISKKVKTIWIGVLIMFILFICFLLFLRFLTYFVTID